jgi:hypothetical protein
VVNGARAMGFAVSGYLAHLQGQLAITARLRTCPWCPKPCSARRIVARLRTAPRCVLVAALMRVLKRVRACVRARAQCLQKGPGQPCKRAYMHCACW